MSTTVPQDFVVATGLASLTPEQQRRAVFVTNISSAANLKKVSDFFSFCGNIQTIVQDKDPAQPDKQMAVVVFEEEGSASTALLLGQAIIVDSPIVVNQYVPPAISRGANASFQGSAASGISGQQRAYESGSQNAVSVVASLAAAGYLKGTELIKTITAKAKELDDKANISETAHKGIEQAAAKAKNIDEQLHITEKVELVKQTTVQQAKQLDEKFQITDKAKLAKEKVVELGEKALQQDVIKKGVEIVNAGWTSVVGAWNHFRSETKNEIAKQSGNVGAAASSSRVADDQVNQPYEQEDQQQQHPEQQQQQQKQQSIYPSTEDPQNVDQQPVQQEQQSEVYPQASASEGQ